MSFLTNPQKVKMELLLIKVGIANMNQSHKTLEIHIPSWGKNYRLEKNLMSLRFQSMRLVIAKHEFDISARTQ